MAEIKWIPYKKKPPKKTGSYLITWNYVDYNKDITEPPERKVTIWWFVNDGTGFGIHMNDKVIAWSPLPEPYDEKEETDGV